MINRRKIIGVKGIIDLKLMPMLMRMVVRIQMMISLLMMMAGQSERKEDQGKPFLKMRKLKNIFLLIKANIIWIFISIKTFNSIASEHLL